MVRGVLLIVLALSNGAWFMQTPAGESPWWLRTLVEGSGYPAFLLLLGYGVGQMLRRGQAAVRGIALRHVALLVLGLAHAGLLWHGDALGAYGLMGLALTPVALRVRTRWLGVIVAVLLAVAVAMAALSALSGSAEFSQSALSEGMRTTGYAESASARVLWWALSLALIVFNPVMPALFLGGVLMSRARVLEQIGEHRVSVGLLGLLGVVIMLVTGDALSTAGNLGMLDSLSGVVGSLGLVLVISVVSTMWAPRPVVALGKMSLSGYVLMSVVMMPVISPWGLGIELDYLGLLGLAGFAYLLSMAVATWFDARGTRGPLERLVRWASKLGTTGRRRDPVASI